MTNALYNQMGLVLLKQKDLTPNGFICSPRDLGYECNLCPADLLDSAMLQQFDICQGWLKLCDLTISFNQKHTSYRYKHLAEKWADHYVCNGALIAAAIALGIKVQRLPNSPNALLPISEKSIKALSSQKLDRQKLWRWEAVSR